MPTLVKISIICMRRCKKRKPKVTFDHTYALTLAEKARIIYLLAFQLTARQKVSNHIRASIKI